MELMDYLQENKKRHLDDAALCMADNREGDAVLAKIRANVFDIFMQTGGKTDKILAHLKIKWQEAQELAAQHGDTAAAAIEQIKLATLSEIEQEVSRCG